MDKVIIGIDFGTSGIGFAYAFLNENNTSNVTMGGENNYQKIPAQIILDENLENVIAFGNDCDSYIQNNPPNSYNHFTKIKMNLYHK